MQGEDSNLPDFPSLQPKLRTCERTLHPVAQRLLVAFKGEMVLEGRFVFLDLLREIVGESLCPGEREAMHHASNPEHSSRPTFPLDRDWRPHDEASL